MKEVVRGARTEARLGGVPTPAALTAAFLKVKTGRVDAWAQAFCLLRAGDAAAAQAVLEESRADPEFAALFGAFVKGQPDG